MGPAQASRLTKVQRNELYRAVEQAGLDLAQCQLTEKVQPGTHAHWEGKGIFSRAYVEAVRESSVTTIAHESSESRFSIEEYTSGEIQYLVTSVFAGTQRSAERYRREGSSYLSERIWKAIVEAASDWAATVKAEYVDPDYWSEFRRGAHFFATARGEAFANAAFTPDEQRQIAHQLSVIGEYVKNTYALTLEQARHLDEQFDEAAEASKRMERKDWLLLFGGALLSLLLSSVVPPEAIHHILTMTAHSLGHLFGPPAAPLPPGSAQ
jgi:hypothetical protein